MYKQAKQQKEDLIYFLCFIDSIVDISQGSDK